MTSAACCNWVANGDENQGPPLKVLFRVWGFSKLGVAPVARIIVSLGLYWGPPTIGNYQMRTNKGPPLGGGY